MDPLVSIVIPVYKTEAYLRSCVASAVRQTYTSLEVILVDDGSPDNCPAICDELAAADERIIVIHQQNGGLSAARNTGIEKASGDYILFLDSDDTLQTQTITDMMKIIQQKACNAVYPHTYNKVYEAGGKCMPASHFPVEMFCEDPKKFAIEVLIGKGRARRSTAVLYDHNIIQKHHIRYPFGYISEDFFFNLDFLRNADSIALYTEPSLNNLKRAGSISASYYEDFFDTVLKMDESVEQFMAVLDHEKYKASLSGRRETLLYRNLLIFCINVMGDRKSIYVSS